MNDAEHTNENLPCSADCPFGIDVATVARLIALGKYDNALALVRRYNPFPGITSRLCDRYCERSCLRKDFDEPVAIAGLIRFLADYEIEMHRAPRWDFSVGEPQKKSVGIIGAGPAGLMCAYDLARRGYNVKIYETLQKPGGMLMAGIPAFTLPRDVLFGEVQLLKNLGVDFAFGCTVGKDISFAELIGRYDAVFIAIGAHRSAKLHIPGSGLERVFSAVEIMKKINLGEDVATDNRAVIIGAGKEAFAVARSIRRIKSRATIICPYSEDKIAVSNDEKKRAIEEGVEILHLTRPTAIIGEAGKVSGIRCVRMEYAKETSQKKMKLLPVSDSSFDLDCDMVIYALSRGADVSPLLDYAKKLVLSNYGTFIVDENTLATNIEGVFAGGEAVLGRASVMDAFVHGRRAANSIHRFISGGHTVNIATTSRSVAKSTIMCKLPNSDVEHSSRAEMIVRSLKERMRTSYEVYIGFTEERANYEAHRCLAKERKNDTNNF